MMANRLQSTQQLISDVLLSERTNTGRKLERITTAISREIITMIKHESVRSYFNEKGHALVFLEKELVPEVGELPIGEFVISMQEGERMGVAGRFEYPEGGGRPDENAIVAMIRLPRNYDFHDFHLLVPDLKDALRHEIEHAFQSAETLSGLSGMIDQYSSMDSLKQYLLSKAETEAHMAGFYKKAKMLKLPVSDVLDEELENLMNISVREGLPKDEVTQLLKRVKKQWLASGMRRYPNMK
tara:strand:+ start:3563 stop:4285 length:723 start_codon:yes stop_codon:yes gene_type:complete